MPNNHSGQSERQQRSGPSTVTRLTDFAQDLPRRLRALARRIPASTGHAVRIAAPWVSCSYLMAQ